MRKKILRAVVLIIFCFGTVTNSGFSLSVIRPVSTGNKISEQNNDYLRAAVFVKLSPKEFETITGKKLNLPQRIYFRIIQRKLKHELKKNSEFLITEYFDPKTTKFKFDLLWFVIAAFIGPLGLLLAYISPQRKGGPAKKDKVTSAWLGLALFILWFGFSFLF